MGTYYDVVCPEHKEVLHLWKADMLWDKLEYMVDKKKLAKEGTPDFPNAEFIVLQPFTFKIFVKERPKSLQWLEKHQVCKLFFIDSEYSDTFNYYESFVEVNGQ